ncbi:beta-lactamase superfamily domain-containing protein [Cyathus striatus]|nr:beta-lactamase superfamily domain-containing protein [Cyathus striatus]
MMTSKEKFNLTLDTQRKLAPTRTEENAPSSLPLPKQIKGVGKGASLYFIGTATTILEWAGIRLMTDPNFLHAGDHVHLGPGITGTRLTNPAVNLEELPPIDIVLLSHYHADHFDEKVESSLRRDIPIVTTPHAYDHLSSKADGEAFTNVRALDHYETGTLAISSPIGLNVQSTLVPKIKVTAMPGKHVPPGPGHLFEKVNKLLSAVPPTNGWMVELGFEQASGEWKCGYRIYISGDTLLVDDLKEIPEHYKGKQIDLMLVHLGGTTIPGPHLPLLMITMDAKQGVALIQLINPELTIPIHFDDYDVFLSGLDEFKSMVETAGLNDKVVYLDRGDAFHFDVKV